MKIHIIQLHSADQRVFASYFFRNQLWNNFYTEFLRIHFTQNMTFRRIQKHQPPMGLNRTNCLLQDYFYISASSNEIILIDTILRKITHIKLDESSNSISRTICFTTLMTSCIVQNSRLFKS